VIPQSGALTHGKTLMKPIRSSQKKSSREAVSHSEERQQPGVNGKTTPSGPLAGDQVSGEAKASKKAERRTETFQERSDS
jgi:hypothetical protein